MEAVKRVKDNLVKKVLRKAEKRRLFYKENGREFKGWSTGFDGLDDLTGGIPREGVYLLSGEPGVGKTTLAMHIAASVARKIPVVYLTFENNPISIMEKILCSNAPAGQQSDGIQIGALRRGIKSEETIKEIRRRAERKEWLDRLQILGPESLDPDEKWTIKRLEDRVSTLVQNSRSAPGVGDQYGRPECLVVVDYLQHWAKRNPDYKNKSSVRARVEEMAGDLASLEVDGDGEFSPAVLAVASQNRRRGYGQNHSSGQFQSSLSSLKESGDLEYIADVVMFLVRDQGMTGSDDVRRLTLEVMKNRHGGIGKVSLMHRGDTAQFWPK